MWRASAALTPIVAMRGSDGVVRAFRNACRHRGVQLVDGTGCKKALTCRYHAWTYGLDGALRGVPHEHGFPGLDKSASRPRAGQDVREARPGVRHAGRGECERLDEDLVPELFGPEWRLFSTTEQEFAATGRSSPKVSSRATTSARRTATRSIRGSTTTSTSSSPSAATAASPFRTARIEKLRDVPPAERKAGGTLTHVYHLFPNVSIATFPNNMTMIGDRAACRRPHALRDLHSDRSRRKR